MTTRLQRYFRDRGIAETVVAPGIFTPGRFSDPVAEHRATRHACGLFDFSFMACVEIRGPHSLRFLHRLQTRNLTRLSPGRIAYTLLLREEGSVLNDATVWCFDANHYALFVGRRSDVRHLRQVAVDFDVTLTERSDDHAVIALQGPRSRTLLDICLDEPSVEMPYFGFWSATFRTHPCWIARMGYSGETGYEIIIAAAHAPALWEALRQTGKPLGLAECGFHAINSLRIEAGHVFFDTELMQAVTPFELALSRLVDMYLYDFIGKKLLLPERRHAPLKRFVGLIPALHHGDLTIADIPPLTQSGSRVRVTSACHSPLFNRVIALGFVASEDAYPGTCVRLSPHIMARVARLPFYDPGKVLPRRAPTGTNRFVPLNVPPP